MSKTLMIYYSLEGNTDFAAQTAAECGDIDLERLIPEKEPPKAGFGKFFWGGKSVVFSETPPLQPLKHSPDDYESIIIGFPVWAGSYPPAVATFLKEHPFTGKRCSIIACSAGGNAEKAVNKLKEKLPGNEFGEVLSLKDPAKDKENSAELIRKFTAAIE